MSLSDETQNFNKEIIFAELGAALGGPLFGIITEYLTQDYHTIAFAVVIGSLTGSVLCWLILRIKNQKKTKGNYTTTELAMDIIYFTPFAFTTAMLVYQPILYFITRNLLEQGHEVITSVITAQVTAFATFLIIINIYRILLNKYLGKKL